MNRIITHIKLKLSRSKVEPKGPVRPPLKKTPWSKIIWHHTPPKSEDSSNKRTLRSLRHPAPFVAPVVITFIICSALIVFIWNISINQVECFTQYGLCSDKYSEIARQLIGQKVVRPSWSPVVIKLSAFPEVQKVETSRRLPSTAVLTIFLRSPLGSVSSDISGNPGAIVDGNGKVMKNTTDPAFPLLIVADFTSTTTNIAPNQVSALKVLRQLDSLLTARSIGNLEGLVLTVTSPGNPKIVIDISKPVSSWQTSLQSILARSKISSKQPEKIDLRFNDPILVYNQ